MHEMAVITDIIDAVCREAKLAGAHRVVSITISVGEIRDFHEDLVQDYFNWFARGTLAEGAIITMNTIPLKYACDECGSIYHLDLPTMSVWSDSNQPVRFETEPSRCPMHPDAETHIVSGNELFIEDIVVE